MYKQFQIILRHKKTNAIEIYYCSTEEGALDLIKKTSEDYKVEQAIKMKIEKVYECIQGEGRFLTV